MSVLINPGSGPIADGDGWTNTYEVAVETARRWLDEMVGEGFGGDITLELPGEPVDGGRWRFAFRHRVTGVVNHLETHGISPLAAYLKERVFDPREYWRGSSCSNPELAHWAAEGFVQTFRREGTA